MHRLEQQYQKPVNPETLRMEAAQEALERACRPIGEAIYKFICMRDCCVYLPDILENVPECCGHEKYIESIMRPWTRDGRLMREKGKNGVLTYTPNIR